MDNIVSIDSKRTKPIKSHDIPTSETVLVEYVLLGNTVICDYNSLTNQLMKIMSGSEFDIPLAATYAPLITVTQTLFRGLIISGDLRVSGKCVVATGGGIDVHKYVVNIGDYDDDKGITPYLTLQCKIIPEEAVPDISSSSGRYLDEVYDDDMTMLFSAGVFTAQMNALNDRLYDFIINNGGVVDETDEDLIGFITVGKGRCLEIHLTCHDQSFVTPTK